MLHPRVAGPTRLAALALLAVLGLCACASAPPASPKLEASATETPLATTTWATLGVNPAGWLAAVDEIERRALPVDQMALMVDGHLVAELHRNGHGVRSLHDLRSTTKSITSLLVGAAWGREALAALDKPIAPLFPEFAGSAPAQLTMRQLLTMRHGLDCNDWVSASRGNEERMYRSDDWLKFFFAVPVGGRPPDALSYCTAAIVVAGEALARQVREPLPVLARRALFEPLGIAGEVWAPAPRGVTDAGGHLRLTLHAMLKIGELMRQGGMWQGRRLIDAQWVAASLEPAVRVDRSGLNSQAWFGLSWWLEPVREGRAASFQSRGNGGQYIIVIPEFKAVLAFTGHAYNADRAIQMAPMDLTSRLIVPALRARGATALP